jgi:hypothetical protein
MRGESQTLRSSLRLRQAAVPIQDIADGHADGPAPAAADATMSRPPSDAGSEEDKEGAALRQPFVVKRSHQVAGPLFSKVPRRLVRV